MVLSADNEADLQVLALNAASAASVSDVDIFNSVEARYVLRKSTERIVLIRRESSSTKVHSIFTSRKPRIC